MANVMELRTKLDRVRAALWRTLEKQSRLANHAEALEWTERNIQSLLDLRGWVGLFEPRGLTTIFPIGRIMGPGQMVQMDRLPARFWFRIQPISNEHPWPRDDPGYLYIEAKVTSEECFKFLKEQSDEKTTQWSRYLCTKMQRGETYVFLGVHIGFFATRREARDFVRLMEAELTPKEEK